MRKLTYFPIISMLLSICFIANGMQEVKELHHKMKRRVRNIETIENKIKEKNSTLKLEIRKLRDEKERMNRHLNEKEKLLRQIIQDHTNKFLVLQREEKSRRKKAISKEMTEIEKKQEQLTNAMKNYQNMLHGLTKKITDTQKKIILIPSDLKLRITSLELNLKNAEIMSFSLFVNILKQSNKKLKEANKKIRDKAFKALSQQKRNNILQSKQKLENQIYKTNQELQKKAPQIIKLMKKLMQEGREIKMELRKLNT